MSRGHNIYNHYNESDRSRYYTVLNYNEAEIGMRCIGADSVEELYDMIFSMTEDDLNAFASILVDIKPSLYHTGCFAVKNPEVPCGIWNKVIYRLGD